MRGRISAAVAVAAAVGLAACLPASSKTAATPLTYTVDHANGSATLIFHATDAEGLSNDNGRVALSFKKTAPGKGSILNGKGSARALIGATLAERVRLKRKGSQTGPYLVTTCKQTTKQKTRGGVTFRRSGSNVLVRWAFPQAQTRFCPGPKVRSSLTSGQTALYPASRFNQRRVTLVLTGSQSVDNPLLQASYRWRVTVVLERSG